MPRCKALALRTSTLFAVLLVSACASLSPYSSLTKLDLTLSASDQLNPDLNGRPSPIVVRLMELKHPVAFENADFFSLYERAKESLAPDLVASEELELRPGESVELKLSVDSQSRYVGVLAAYRDLPETRWRYVIPVTAMQVTRSELILDQAGIRNRLQPVVREGERP
ncbi:type VI secretion system protein VasD [Pseudomonas sp. NFPP10]|uniref:type VI secretion system lipoprotein TssJ n=1 Tax=Pseudomonas TaxID=286 RepID=UPI00088E2291|nr:MULTISPECIES: type VI secretion system lipoprotein TssJ [Pseudomonas]BCQ61105.1 type VI secretion system-associated lipoprotein [Pseudomonas sp. Boi14]MBP5099520.1 type VI secretion system lipoprotein TssJ [Pseudomonas protegens]MBP5119449.1 type VI secretion system lipoprotein TssJ [Pseudomonas protegens]MBP5126041.1 type VI secretion system lipoprotein TssJ [Pseudomonas protegens]POA83146.1 type VI secretion system lipoprotein TssJ [Pseudomonas protegens]